MESKEIKVYGTLVNHTTIDPNNSTLYPRVDSQHNDSIAYAYQLYDDRFGASPAPENYQDNINKRVKGITYNDLDNSTTIHNLIVDGISGIKLGDLDDVTTTGETAGDFLKFDGTQWIPAVIALSDIDGFDVIGTPSEGDIIKYVNNQWTFTKNKLDELYDVDITNKANGSILKWNSTSNKWEIGTDSIGSILPAGDEGKVLKYINGLWVAADDLTGDALPEGSEGKVLKYINGSWVSADDNDTKQLSALTDVNISNVTVGNILKYNGSKWIADTISTGGGGATKLSELSDVDSSVDNPSNGDVLTYDSGIGKWKAVGEEEGSSSAPSDATYHYYNQTYTYLTTIPASVAVNPIHIGFGAVTKNSTDDVAGLPMREKDYYYIYVLSSQDKAYIPSGEIYYNTEYTNVNVNSLPYSVYPSGVQTYAIDDTTYTNNVNGNTYSNGYFGTSYFVPSDVYNTIVPNTTSGGNYTPVIQSGSNNTNSPIYLHLEVGLSSIAKAVNDYTTIADNDGDPYETYARFVKDGYAYGFFTKGQYTDYGQPLGFTSRFYKCLTVSNNNTINRTYSSISESDFKAATQGFTIPAGASYLIVGPVTQKPADTITEKITTYESGEIGLRDIGKGLLIGEVVAVGTAMQTSPMFYEFETHIPKDIASRIISITALGIEDDDIIEGADVCKLISDTNGYYSLYAYTKHITEDGRSVNKVLFRVLLKK